MSKNRSWDSNISAKTSRVVWKFLSQTQWRIRNKMYETNFLWKHFHSFLLIVQKSYDSLIYRLDVALSIGAWMSSIGPAKNFFIEFLRQAVFRMITQISLSDENFKERFFLHCYQASKRAARPGPGWPNKTSLSGRASRSTKVVGPGGPRFLSGRPGPTFLCFFFYFLSNFIPVIGDRNY